jgi:dienelactone hydrolase
LAQAGFVGLAPNIISLQLDSMTAQEKRDVFVNKITDEHMFEDLLAGADYLKSQPIVKRGRMGITGFCFGGRCALMFAATSKDIGAAAPFYGNLKTPAFANRSLDPVDLVKQMKVPIQGHYAGETQRFRSNSCGNSSSSCSRKARKRRFSPMSPSTDSSPSRVVLTMRKPRSWLGKERPTISCEL